jgi:ADP-ribose pyrophosphatase YjhB (NUDIX family)
MKKLWPAAGIIAFWCSWPGLWFYLHKTRRTRVVISSQGRVALVKVWLSAEGAWSLPGGGLHGSEDPRTAAVREVREEIGIDIAGADMRELGNHMGRTRGFRYSYDIFATELAAALPLTPQPGEILKADWFSLDEITYMHLNSEALAALQVWREQAALLQ